MQVTDILSQMGGLQSMAKELGVSEAEVENGASALIPAILGGFKKQAQSQPAGLEGLEGLLGQLGGDSLLDNVLAPQPTDISRGNDVLGQIFGSKEVSRNVAQNAASQSGVSSSLLKKMLPMLAMLIAGYMSKQRGTASAGQPSPSAGGGLGGVLESVLGGGQTSGSATSGSGLPGLAAMLDFNGDGNALDDILRIVGKVLR
ncbi:MAG: DUF937 domain-containing protein [Desulfovibrionales bacterium]|nr:DUF937 domain-containing protein [Desulfovibrionales bacterium]